MKTILVKTGLFLVLVCLLSHSARAAPTKKDKEKNKLKQDVEINDTKVTEEEKKFIREIEEKFNINSEDDQVEAPNKKGSDKVIKFNPKKLLKAPFPAVIAIEIVNDTSVDGKGKRTIDANLGYGYKTNNGYFYQQFGKNEPENRKFMVYPYSQHDILPLTNIKENQKYHTKVFTNKATGDKTYVEIQPSKAYQLVPINSNEHESRNSYSPNDVVSHLRTKYENVQAVETPPPPQYSSDEDYYSHSQTESPTVLYSTFNGGHLSGLSGNFPMVMPNYYVNPSQLLDHSQFQSLGASSGHSNENFAPRRVIPVLILRIPSSQIQHPVAELYPKLPHSNPYATTINSANLEALVNQYLANLQSQFAQESHSHQQLSFVNQHQPVYSDRQSLGGLDYSSLQSPESHYAPVNHPSYYQQQPYSDEQSGQPIQYVSHPSHTTKIQIPNGHMSFSQVYNGNLEHQPRYEQSEDDAQNLPISENYPDSSHTRVILNPHYSVKESNQNTVKYVPSQSIEYATPSADVNRHVYKNFGRSEPSVQIINHGEPTQDEAESDHLGQVDSYGNAQENSSNDENESKYQLTSQSNVPQSGLYNYHAHPYPKRQVKASDKESNKATQRNRRLRSGVETGVKTKH